METDKYSDYVGILTFLSQALMVLAFLMACFLLWRAILWLRDRMNPDDGAVEDIEDLKDPWEQAISRPAADYYWDEGSSYGGGEGGLGSMNRREQEELLLFAGTRKQQKAIRRRRKAAMASMSQRRRDEYFLIHGSRKERKAAKERSKASEQVQKKQSDS